MPTNPGLVQIHEEMTAWRQELHAHPQTAFEETYASDFVAARLEEMGISTHRGLAKTGVVGTLEGSRPNRDRVSAIGLRADIDALDVCEENRFEHKSRNSGKMHACGHDGHTAMLLGAAKFLAETRNFRGTVHFVFQPAEENEAGGRVMVEEGLFDKFPVDAIFGMHNWPGLEVGQFAVRSGPVMAAFDVFEIKIQGQGSHGAMPHLAIDPMVAAAQVVTALQTISSRITNPMDPVVVSVTQIHGGDTWNVIPPSAVLRGTTRAFREDVQDTVESSIRQIAEGVCAAMGATAECHYQRRYPATVNTEAETKLSARVAEDIVDAANVHRDPTPSMASEDFAFMLQQRPGCYIWIGNGSDRDGRRLHNPRYDFNDEILPIGASYWTRLVETVLG